MEFPIIIGKIYQQGDNLFFFDLNNKKFNITRGLLNIYNSVERNILENQLILEPRKFIPPGEFNSENMYELRKINVHILKGPFTRKEIVGGILKNISSKDAFKNIIFSAFIDTILLHLGVINELLEINSKYFMMLVGGLAMKVYYPSHKTFDFDLKIFPKDFSKEIDKTELFNFLISIFTPLVYHLNKHQNHIIYSYFKMLDIYKIRHPILDSFKKAYDKNPRIIFQFSIPPENPDLIKLIVIFDSKTYKLGDIDYFKNDDSTNYNKLIRKINERISERRIHPILNDDGKMISYVKVPNAIWNYYELDESENLKTIDYFINIPSKEHINLEKEILYEDIQKEVPELNPKSEYLETKFKKAVDTIEKNKDKLIDKTFIQKY